MGKDWIYQQRYIKCGKPACRRCAEGPGHGPYWYGFRRRKFRGRKSRVQSKYFGKRRPVGANPPGDARRPDGPMDYKTALRVFALLGREPTARQVQLRYWELSKRHHPDKGGDTEKMQRINSAYEVLRRRHGGAGS